MLMSASLKNLQYVYYKDLYVDYPPLGNDQDNLVTSGLSHMEYYSPLVDVNTFSRLVHTVC